VRALVEANTREDGHTFVGVSQVARTVGVTAPKLTAAQSRRVCQVTAYAGFALEPDVRLTGKTYRPDQVVAVFPDPADGPVDPTRYAAASCMLRVGMLLVGADGDVDEREVSLLSQQIRQAFDLSEAEQRRLEALRGLLEHQPPAWSTLGRLATSMSLAQREATAKLMLALAAADGVVTEDELKAIRKGYAALGLGRETTEAAIASLTAAESSTTDEPPTVMPALAATGPLGEVIPPPPGPPQAARPAAPAGLRLDRAAIAAIMSDTREVAQMLAAAMQAEPDDGPSRATGAEQPGNPATVAMPAATVTASPPARPMPVEPDVVATDDTTLPTRYAAFYRLLVAKGRWELREADRLARDHGHMLSGAIEALNEWAFEQRGAQLFVEDGDALVIEQDLLN
jgi:uncharacterized tellurite resistance protein B-like protein